MGGWGVFPQPRSPGSSSSTLWPIYTSINHRPISTCSCPPLTRTSPTGQSKPHQWPSGQSEPRAGRWFSQPCRGQPEHADERARWSRNGRRRGRGARLVGLVVLSCQGWCAAYDCVLQFQPQSLSAGDEHPPPHVSVSLLSLSLHLFSLNATTEASNGWWCALFELVLPLLMKKHKSHCRSQWVYE